MNVEQRGLNDDNADAETISCLRLFPDDHEIKAACMHNNHAVKEKRRRTVEDPL
jgi:hypothetical protein